MERYLRRAHSGSRGWGQVAVTVVLVPVLFAVFWVLCLIPLFVLEEVFLTESWYDVGYNLGKVFGGNAADGELAPVAARVSVVGTSSLAVLLTLTATQRGVWGRTLVSYLTAAPRIRGRYVAEGLVAGLALSGVGLGTGWVFGWVGGTGAAAPLSAAALLLIGSLILVQSLAEEVVRGVALQASLRLLPRGWMAVLASGTIAGAVTLASVSLLAPVVSPPAAFLAGFLAHLVAAGIALLDDGLERVIGAHAGLRLILTAAALEAFPLQIQAPLSVFGLVGGAAVVVALASAPWAGWSASAILRAARLPLHSVSSPTAGGGTVSSAAAETANAPPPAATEDDSDGGDRGVEDGAASAALDTCLNCGADLDGSYCSTCGQKGVDRHRSITELIPEVFEVFFEIDGRIWRTMRLLVMRPGLLTRHYNAGRRRSFIRPLRLYIATSVAFFLLIVTIPTSSPVAQHLWGDQEWDGQTWETAAPEDVTQVANRVRVHSTITRLDRANRRLFVHRIPFAVDSATTVERSPADRRRRSDSAAARTDSPPVDSSARDSFALARFDVGQPVAVDGLRLPGGYRATAVEIGSVDDTLLAAPLQYASPDSVRILETTVPLTDSTEMVGVEDASELRGGQRVVVEVARAGSQVVATSVTLDEQFSQRLEQGDPRALSAFVQAFSRILFVLVPLFGLLLQVVYRETLYVGNLIFALHTHSFAFLLFAGGVVAIQLSSFFGPDVFNLADDVFGYVLVVAIPLYVTAALRRVYRESWAGAFVKSVVLLLLYGVVVFLAATVNLGILSNTVRFYT